MEGFAEVVILGSGTCVPSIRRAGPSACFMAEGVTILIDSAAGTLRQLVRAGIPYDQVDLIFYTHLHPDHVGEFVPFVFATRYAPGYNRTRPVRILAAEGFCSFYDSLKQAFGEWVEPRDHMVEVDEIPVSMPASMQIPPFTVKTVHTVHTPQSLAYRIETSSGISVCFTGDTDFCPGLIELASGADLLVSECAAPEGKKIPGHLTPSEAGRMAEKAGVKRLVLTHFYPNCDTQDILGPCRAVFNGPVIKAEDMMRVVV